MEESRSALKILTDKPIGKRPLGSPRCKRKDNVGMNIEGIDVSVRNWVDSAEGRDFWRTLVNAAFILRFP